MTNEPPVDPAAPGPSEPDVTAQKSAEILEKRLRPIWELELLISGAVVFSLFQLPGLLSRVFADVGLHLSREIFLLPFMLYYGATLLVIALILAFVSHFFLRAFWVALCGLNSAFPEGIRWDHYDSGPITLRALKALVIEPKELEKKVDRLASMIFSGLFLVVLSLISSFGWILGLSFLIFLGLRPFVPDLPLGVIFYGVLAVLLLPLLVVQQLDRWFKNKPERLDSHPRLARFAETTFHNLMKWSGGQVQGTLQSVFSTHFSSRGTSWVLAAAIFLIAGIFIVSMMLTQGLLGFDSYVYFPNRPNPLRMDASYYENLRSEDASRSAPTIQADTIQDPYLRLFVPYHLRRDLPLIKERCPEIEPFRGDGFYWPRKRLGDEDDFSPVLACFTRLYQVRLNGEPIVDPGWNFYRRSQDQVVGVVAYLTVEGLPKGRNLLEIDRPLTKKEEAEKDEAKDEDPRQRPAFIPFWL